MAQVKVKQKIRNETFGIIREQIKSEQGLNIVVQDNLGKVHKLGKVTDAFNLGGKIEVHATEGIGRVDADSHFMIVDGNHWALVVAK